MELGGFAFTLYVKCTHNISVKQGTEISRDEEHTLPLYHVYISDIHGQGQTEQSGPSELMILVLRVEGTVDFRDDHSQICLPLAVRRL